MVKYIRAAALPAVAVVAIVLTLAACKGEPKNDTLSQDSTLNQDLQLANKDSAATPALQDVPANTNPAPSASSTAPATTPRSTSTPKPAPTPTPTRPTTTANGNSIGASGAREPALGTIAAGSTLSLASSARICTNTNKVGDRIQATVNNAVSGSNGVSIPAGARVTLEITQLKRSENVRDNITMGFRPVSVAFNGRTYPISGEVQSAQVDRVKNQPGGKDAQKVATGAGVGAIVGQILGKSTKSTVIGGAIGAAAGAGAAAATSNYEGCLPVGGNITVSLSNSVQVHAS